MLKRIVKLTFQPEKVAEFVKVFEENKHLIRGFEGCLHLELLRQKDAPNVYFTLSHWESETHLNAYRHSPLFKATWARTKVLFSDKPLAWSLDSCSIL